ncbi:MAG TPA: COX15/CtaA family protein [Geminicoccaceae bacterium]|nr:COX15/CtaA family protein [Geminicoccaceae bacterium]
MKPIRRTAAATAVLIYALIVLGALVRTTDSGLSCPDWPTCYGHWVPLPSDLAEIPNLGYSYGQIMLEWVHRLIAGVILGPLVLVLAVMTFRRRRDRPALAVAGVALLLLLLAQGALGGLTVLDRNSPWSVAIHLGNALLVLTVTLGIYAGAAGWRASGGGDGRLLLTLAVAAWGLALLATMSAAVTAKTGSSLACTTWPLCDGAIVPDLSDGGVRIHFAHRVLAAATGLALLLLFWRSRVATGTPAGVRRLAALAAALVVLQIGLGGLVVLLEVPVWSAVLHQAAGVLTFATVALLMWRCRPLGGGVGRPLPGGSDGLALRGA